MITAKLYIPEANADISYMDKFELFNDYQFEDAVEEIVKETIDEYCLVELEFYANNNYRTNLYCK